MIPTLTPPSSRAFWSRWKGLRGAYEPGNAADTENFGALRSYSRGGYTAQLCSRQADRHDHLHWLQGLRSSLRRMERLSVLGNHVQQQLPDHAGHPVELLESHQV